MHYRVTWIQIQGTKYVEGYVVVLDSTKILPIFGMIINILLINSDEPYFVCEVLETEEFSSHFHSFVVQRDSILQAKQPDRLPHIRTVQLTTLS